MLQKIKNLFKKDQSFDLIAAEPTLEVPVAEHEVTIKIATDKELDVVLEQMGLSRREVYDFQQKETKGAAFPNNPAEVYSWAVQLLEVNK